MMLVDCQTCPVRDVHCADCMVTALAAVSVPLPAPTVVPPSLAGSHAVAPGATPEAEQGALPETVPLDRAERRAVSVLLAAGLVSLETANGARALRSAPASSYLAETHRAETHRAETHRAETPRAQTPRADTHRAAG